MMHDDVSPAVAGGRDPPRERCTAPSSLHGDLASYALDGSIGAMRPSWRAVSGRNPDLYPLLTCADFVCASRRVPMDVSDEQRTPGVAGAGLRRKRWALGIG